MRHIASFFICYHFLISSLSAQLDQNSQIIPDEYIVQLHENVNENLFFDKVLGNSILQRSQFASRILIMEKPFRLWLIKGDEVLHGRLKNSEEVIFLTKNKMLQSRKKPNDPLFSSQWQLDNSMVNPGKDFNILKAWDHTTGGINTYGDTVVIAVIDDGVNGMHEDLIGNMWINHNEVPNNGIDDDENGYLDDYYGWNVTLSNDNVNSGGGHGTPVAGIVGAKGNNGIGVSGVNWHVKIMAINYGFASEANALASYGYAYTQRLLYNTTNGAKGAFLVATNASWGVDNAFPEDAPLWCALYDSLGVIGVINCAATVNSNADVDLVGDLPTTCNSPYLIAVTNMNEQDNKVIGAGYGRKSIDIGAYGAQTYTLTTTNYGRFGGTSAASPHVTGVFGLIYSAKCNFFDSIARFYPAQAALIAKDMLLNSTTKLPNLSFITTTGGKLNVNATIENLLTLCGDCQLISGISTQPREDGVQLDWLTGSKTSATVRYRKLDEPQWTVVTQHQSGQIISGLEFCTEYELQVDISCKPDFEEFSHSYFFRTNSCCNLPENLSFTNDENSIFLSWEKDSIKTYMLEYSFNLEDWISVNIEEEKFEWSDLPNCYRLYYKIQSICEKYGSRSEISIENTLNTTCGLCTDNNYCTYNRKDNSQEWIKKVSLGNFSNTTKREQNGYGLYAGIQDIDVKRGTTLPMNIEIGYLSNAFSDYIAVYLDANQDGLFDDSESLYTSPTGVTSILTTEVTIPKNSNLGHTRLRVILSYDKIESPCDFPKYDYGEVEDYCLRIFDDNCPNETLITPVEITANSIKFQSSTMDTITLHYRVKGSPSWQTSEFIDSITISDMDTCAVYEYRYAGRCLGALTAFSLWTETKTKCNSNTLQFHELYSIYPIPCHDRLTLANNSRHISINKLAVYDVLGKEVHLKIEYLANGDTQIETSPLVQGTYYLYLIDENGLTLTSKFIKI